MTVMEPDTDHAPVGGMRRYLSSLRNAEDSEVAAVACREACVSLGFSKAMFSRVAGPSWAPECVYVTPGIEKEFGELRTAVDGTPVPLFRVPREADLVRLRRPYVLGRREFHRDAYRPLIDLSNPVAYAAAPIVTNGRTVATLHVDRHRDSISDEDVRLLLMAAHLSGIVLATNENRRRHHSQREMLAGLLENVLNADVGRAPSSMFDREENTALTVSRTALAPVTAALIEREKRVLQLVAAGATNRQIAEELFISDSTVKTDVRRIFRKLGVESRAQAAAYFRESKGHY